MADPKLRICWDACCFIALFRDEDGSENCRTIIEDARDGQLELVASTVAIAEVVYGRSAGRPVAQDDRDIVRDFFRQSYIMIRSADRTVAEMAQQIQWDHEVNPRDALHLATAILTECDHLETYDGKLLGLQARGHEYDVNIRRPVGLGTGSLFPKG